MGTSLPAPVALPPCPPGALAGPHAGWGEEAVRRQPPTCLPSSAGPFALPGAAQKLRQGLFQKNNLSGQYFTYINIHLYGYVQMQQEPGR